eukprot:scaffold97832_cov27-Tisochrysis_lutea.AAC.2
MVRVAEARVEVAVRAGPMAKGWGEARTVARTARAEESSGEGAFVEMGEGWEVAAQAEETRAEEGLPCH